MAKVANLVSEIMRDTCLKHYRESFDKLGWLWAQQEAPAINKLYRENLPIVRTLVFVAILLTKDEKI